MEEGGVILPRQIDVAERDAASMKERGCIGKDFTDGLVKLYGRIPLLGNEFDLLPLVVRAIGTTDAS